MSVIGEVWSVSDWCGVRVTGEMWSVRVTGEMWSECDWYFAPSVKM